MFFNKDQNRLPLMAKLRLDVLLTKLGLAESRNKAQALILTGDVLVNDVPVDKAGSLVPQDAEIRIRSNPSKFVGRGGDKIDPIFEHFNINLDGAVAVDIGASTGGFTDSMLSRNAKKVYAVDVGTNQLAHKIRINTRVVVLEKTNAKDLQPEQFSERPSFATIDVSFIGVSKILSPVVNILSSPFSLLVLVKPQFELSPSDVEKGGVITDVAKQLEAVAKVEAFFRTPIKRL